MCKMFSSVSPRYSVKSNKICSKMKFFLRSTWCLFFNSLNPMCNDAHKRQLIWIWPCISGNVTILFFFLSALRSEHLHNTLPTQNNEDAFLASTLQCVSFHSAAQRCKRAHLISFRFSMMRSTSNLSQLSLLVQHAENICFLLITLSSTTIRTNRIQLDLPIKDRRSYLVVL